MIHHASPIDPPAEQLDFFETPMTIPNEAKNFKVHEAAALLNCSNETVRNLIDGGELETYLVNSAIDPQPVRKHHRITGRSLVACLNRRRGIT